MTLPEESGNWVGFSLDSMNDLRVDVKKVFIKGSEKKNSWVEGFYLMYSTKYGRGF